MRRARHALVGVIIVTLALAGTACSDDDDAAETGSSGDTTTEETTGGGGGEADAELAAFCDAFAEVTRAFDGEEPPPAEEGEAMLVDVEQNAPEELAEPVEAAVTAAREALGGDESAFDDAFFESIAAIDGYRFDHCPTDAQVEVAAVEYAFEDAPATVPAGTVAFKMSNEGEEEHEMVVFARAEGETRSFQELVELPEGESDDAVRFVGAAFAPPGSDGVVIADLEPGDYAMVCFIPVGGAEDGPPHAAEGMLAEFTVS